MKKLTLKKNEGISLIDVLIGISLMLIVFLGIFGAYQLELKVIGQSERKSIATAIANQQIEIIKNLPYESVGAREGFPEGVLETTTSTVQNGIEFRIERRVDYAVDSADGIALPNDECPNDYKRVKVKVSWSGKFEGEINFYTDIAPKDLAQECATGGGILSAWVFDAFGTMVSSPLIEVKDPLTNQTLTSATPFEGQHYFSLATSTYKIVISKDGYSIDRTYGTEEVATPEKPHYLILEGQLTETSFSIDKLSSFAVDTFSPWGADNFSDSFLNESKISEKSGVTVADGEVNLIKTPGVYFSGGTTDENLCSFPGIDGDCGQSFTMGSETKEISQVQLYIRKTVADVSDIYLEIREVSPVGQVLAQSLSVTAADIPGTLSWVPFTLESSVSLDANTQYFLRLRSVPDSTDPSSGAKGSVYWGYVNSGTSPPNYALGDAWRYIGKNNDPADPGEQLNQYDFSFKIYDDEYLPSGYLVSIPVSPINLMGWDNFSFSDSEPVNTDLKYQFYYFSGTDWLLIPNTELLGNSSGFDSSPVDLSGLDISTFSELKIKANFSTSDLILSPVLYDWQVSWITDEAVPIPNATFKLQGEKIIGTDSGENEVYKYSSTKTTDSNGHKDIPGLEWDSYTFSVSPTTGLDLIEIEPAPQPIGLLPDTASLVRLYLDAQNSLLLTLEDTDTLEPIFASTVRLYNNGLGYDITQYTNEKGQTYFIPLDIANYNLDIEAPGYLPKSSSAFVSGDVTKIIKLDKEE